MLESNCNIYFSNYYRVGYVLYRTPHWYIIRVYFNTYLYAYAYLVQKILGFMDLLLCQTGSKGSSHQYNSPNWLFSWIARMCVDKVTFINPNYLVNNSTRNVIYPKKHWSYSLELAKNENKSRFTGSYKKIRSVNPELYRKIFSDATNMVIVHCPTNGEILLKLLQISGEICCNRKISEFKGERTLSCLILGGIFF